MLSALNGAGPSTIHMGLSGKDYIIAKPLSNNIIVCDRCFFHFETEPYITQVDLKLTTLMVLGINPRPSCMLGNTLPLSNTSVLLINLRIR